MSMVLFAVVIAGVSAVVLLAGIALGRRRAIAVESELRASEERLRLALRASRDALWDWTVGSDVITWGEGIRDVVGAEAPATVEWWRSNIHPNDREEVVTSLRAAVADPSTTVILTEYRFGRERGGWATVLARGYIVRDAEGRAVRVIGSLSDVTEQRKMQQQLEQAERLTSLGRLAASMAHEFNNVLMAIQPFADVLRRRRDDATVDRAIEQITRAVQRGRRVTEEIMRFTRPTKPALKTIDVGAWLQSIRNELQTLVTPVAVVVDAPLNALGIEGDAGLLHQVLVNLLVNARDAMGGSGLVTIIAAPAEKEEAARHGVGGDAENWVHLTVRDGGRGIEDHDLPHIFEPFFSTKRSGTGLGLAVTHASIQQHGGGIDAESHAGEGTTFHIFLPRVELPADESSPDRDRRRLPRRVLMIEDDEAVVTGLAELLAVEGCDVAVATTGSDGLRKLETFAPEVVILDVDLPDANGRELYDRIRQRTPDLPVVLTSGHVLLGGENDANVVFLQKPYELHALVDAFSTQFPRGEPLR